MIERVSDEHDRSDETDRAPHSYASVALGAFAEMREQYERAKASWGGIAAYDRWFQTGANNAGIAGVGLYADHVPEFTALIAADNYEMPRFFDDVKMLAGMPKGEREARLAALGKPAAVAASDSLGARLLAPATSPTLP